MDKKSYHGICAWTFHSGKGGFTPSNSRPDWSSERLDTIGKIQLIQDRIKPRLPSHIELGLEIHYDYEYNEDTAGHIADALAESGISLAMATPGAHCHFAYGGIASPDPVERQKANQFAKQAVRLVYENMRNAWHAEITPTFVLWNGSFGYDLASVGIFDMYQHLKKSVAAFCVYEAELGGDLHIAIEPKPNEGHPAMLLPTVASTIVFWKKLQQEYGIDLTNKGINKEFGHSEMIGLDHVYDTVEEIDNDMLTHMHINSQGYNDGIILGGPGKYDIDHGARINGMNIAIAGLTQMSGYNRWKGHDMQVRAHDSEEQGIDRIVRSVLSWDACEKAAEGIDYDELSTFLHNRETAKAEDVMRHAVIEAHRYFDGVY